MILPTSYTPLASLLNIGPYPIVSRGLGDVYEGTLDGSRVSVKRFRVYSKEGPMKVIKVHHQHNHLPCAVTDESHRPSTRRLWCGNA